MKWINLLLNMETEKYGYLLSGVELKVGDQYLQDGVWETVKEKDWFLPCFTDDMQEYRRPLVMGGFL